jgi:hypothetical protein
MVARFIFFSIAIAIAGYAWFAYSATSTQYRHETLIVASVMLFFLGFPVSVIYGIVFAVIASLVGLDRVIENAFYNWLLFNWLPCVVLTYLQWFLLIPWVLAWWKTR